MTISKPFFIVILILWATTSLFSQGQMCPGKLLAKNEISHFLNDSLKSAFDLEKPIYKIYEYSDKSGDYLTILNEIKGPYTLQNNDTTNIKATAINFKIEGSSITKMWNFEREALPDFIVGVQDINFLDDYIELKDIDNDTFVEQIIVYQTLTILGLFIIYKNQMISIENHFKGFDVKTFRVDKSFYELPPIIKSYIERKLYSMELSLNIALPNGWLKKMKKQKTLIRVK